MIKRTFLNLPEDKRKRIETAIVEEFSEPSDDKISINRIVKRANISRGSFYQYFDDKVDLIEVLLKSFVDRVLQGLNEAALLDRGDVFEVFEQLFEIIVSFADDKTSRTVLRRLTRNLHANDDLVYEYMTNRFNGIEKYKDCSKRFSRDRLRFKSDSDFDLLWQILISMLKNALFNFYVMEDDCARVRQEYRRKLEILKYGALA